MDKILVVDDDHNILKVIKMTLESQGFQVITTFNVKEALKIAEGATIDLALVDLKLNHENGIELMEDLHKINPLMPVIILTAFGTISTAVEAMKKGAYSYITKPFENNELLLQIRNCLEKSRLSLEVKNLRDIVRKRYGSESIIGKSEKMKRVFEQVAHAADTNSTVYIYGESGTGKELIAKDLHLASPRKDGPFIPINCAAIPETLIESELFGYERGAFTGASRSRKGIFLLAHKGTLFFDEISEMSLAMQAKLLRVFEEGEVFPLGGGRTTQIDVRIIVASNKDLEDEVQRGRFREDLFYRVHVIRIALPALRERKEDIPLLAEHFLKKISGKMNKKIRGFSKSALQKMMRYPWPGNVRELENTIESAAAMTLQDVIKEDLVLQTKDLKEDGFKSFKAAKMEFERIYLTQLIELAKGNISRAAKLAGKYRADLYELLKKHRLDPKDFRA